MFQNYIPIIILGSVNVVVAIGFYLLNNLPFVKKIPYIYRQIIIGVVFGGIAVAGTEFGADIGGAVINVRDAAPLTAGLIFGGPAGVIAGVIGGVERFFAAFWNRGYYTQIACSVSTFLAGIIAAALRKWMFENKTPNWAFGIVIAIFMEPFHLFLIFITHINQPFECLDIVRVVTIPMILANAIVMFLITLFTTLYTYKTEKKGRFLTTINKRIQFWLLLLVMVAAASSNAALIVIQNNFAEETAYSVLYNNVGDLESSILDYSNQIMDSYLKECSSILSKQPQFTCNDLKQHMIDVYTALDLSTVQVNYISKEDGIVKASTDTSNIGFSMYDTEQSASFHEIIIHTGRYSQPFTSVIDKPKEYIKYGGAFFPQTAKSTKGYDGYFQFGFRTESINIDVISSVIKEITKYRRVYSNGFSIIYDYKGNVVSEILGHKISDLTLTTETLDQQLPYDINQGKVFAYDVTDNLYMYAWCETYYIVCYFPINDISDSIDSRMSR